MSRIARMIELAKQDGIDVLRMGIPHDIFISEWQNEYGIDLPVAFIEEIEREFPTGLTPNIAAQYWIQLDEWFMDNEYV